MVNGTEWCMVGGGGECRIKVYGKTRERENDFMHENEQPNPIHREKLR